MYLWEIPRPDTEQYHYRVMVPVGFKDGQPFFEMVATIQRSWRNSQFKLNPWFVIYNGRLRVEKFSTKVKALQFVSDLLAEDIAGHDIAPPIPALQMPPQTAAN